jgi:hypothetical protein
MNRKLIVLTILAILFTASTTSPTLAQPASSERGYTDLVPASPKEPWADFKPIQENEGTPWWAEALLWIPNRVIDFIDIFRVDVGVGPAAGGVVRFTEYGQAGFRMMMPASIRIGDFGRALPVRVESSNEIGISPAFKQSKDRDVCPGEVGAGADLFIIGAYGGVCLDEVIDFVAGVFFLDPKDDDM